MTFQLKSKGPLYSGTDKSLTYIRVEINKRKKSVNVTGITSKKIRAICTRDNPRGVYDLYFMIKRGIITSVDCKS